MTVTLVERYNPAWADLFGRLRLFLESCLGGAAIRIEHVGSTAIPGMKAKPIIDVDIVTEPDDVTTAIARLVEGGYEHEGDKGIPGREALRPRDERLAAELPPHHLYVCPAGSAELRRHIAFRDFLRENGRWARRLSELKWSLCQSHGNDRQAYMDGKAELVREITELALADRARRLPTSEGA